MDLPSHPDADDSADAARTTTSPNWAGRVLVAIIVAALVVVIVLHLAGIVGPA